MASAWVTGYVNKFACDWS